MHSTFFQTLYTIFHVTHHVHQPKCVLYNIIRIEIEKEDYAEMVENPHRLIRFNVNVSLRPFFCKS